MQTENKVKRLAILGSTGSIGQQTLDIVRRFPDRFSVFGLACGVNTAVFQQQLHEFKPQYGFSSANFAKPPSVKFISIEEIASHPDVDMVVVATTGRAGLGPTIAALKAGKSVAIANKEILVMAGQEIQHLAREHGAAILPIDSEHCAIWQCLQGEEQTVSRILLTASGGPFFGMPAERLAEVTLDEALNHPTWKMGKKVTIDSATLFNKGLEVIEAHWLFSIPYEKIQVVIHRQSIIHSMVEFMDGSIKAQLCPPDMHLPIQYALLYPSRVPNSDIKSLNLDEFLTLTLQPVNYDEFPCLKLALAAAKKGGTCPAVLCAADEVAVNLFIQRKLKFLRIAEIIENTLDMHKPVLHPSLDDIMASDEWARETALTIAGKTI
ncbi:MAG: 1-deoxy-D-xylulose-5-phosphate reductoisomerase [Dehalococcoidia bacterium]|nr:1-deoxy-D-xylulose-5-phosphate reductoisomerase [Dehalococcoidia bacterium]